MLSDRTYPTGIVIDEDELNRLSCPYTYVVLKMPYSVDAIERNGFLMGSIEHGFERFIPRSGTVVTAPKAVNTRGYTGTSESVGVCPGDTVWFRPFASYYASGKTTARKHTNMGLVCDGEYYLPVNHNDLICGKRGEDFFALNGNIILESVWPLADEKNAPYGGVVRAVSSEERSILPGTEVVFRLKPHEIEWGDTMEMDEVLYYLHRKFVVGYGTN